MFESEAAGFQSVGIQVGADDLDVIGQRELPLEVARGNTAIQDGSYLPCRSFRPSRVSTLC
jgi:hypothetical protein